MPDENETIEPNEVTEELEAAAETETVEPAPAEPSKPDYSSMSDEELNDILVQRKIVAFHSHDARLARLIDKDEDKEKGKEDEDADSLAYKRDVAEMESRAVTKAEARMTRRYAALDGITVELNKFPDLPVDARNKIIREYQELPVEQMEAALAQGRISRSAKAELYDLVEAGKVKPRATIPSAAPTGGSPREVGLRSRLTKDQRETIEQGEKAFGVKYSDEMIKEALGL